MDPVGGPSIILPKVCGRLCIEQPHKRGRCTPSGHLLQPLQHRTPRYCVVRADPSMDVTSVGRDGHNPVHPTRGGRGARGPAHANVVRSWSTQGSCSDPGKAGAQRTRDGVLGRHVHHGKTQVWNRSGVEPSGMEEKARAARVVKPDAVVWRGDPFFFARDTAETHHT